MYPPFSKANLESWKMASRMHRPMMARVACILFFVSTCPSPASQSQDAISLLSTSLSPWSISVVPRKLQRRDLIPTYVPQALLPACGVFENRSMLRRSRSFGLTRRLQLAATVSGGKDNGQQAARLDCALRRIMEMAPENIGEHAHWLIDSPVIDWDNVPAEVDPHHVTWRGTSIKAGAGIDTTSHETIKRTINPRSARKRAQVETFAEAIRCLSLPTGSRIVDFGSGSGNLVLGLAHLFPVLEFVAVDLKASALKLLAERSQRAGLKNIKTARRDIASFSDEFDVALGLHTCGSASDLVMEQAVQRRAAFLISPCCLGKMVTGDSSGPRGRWIGRGSLMNTRALRDGAPRSRRLQELLGDHDFQLIARLADMSEEQGKAPEERWQRALLCRTLVSLDRLAWAREFDFDTALVHMPRMENFAKTDLLVGLPGATRGDAREKCDNLESAAGGAWERLLEACDGVHGRAEVRKAAAALRSSVPEGHTEQY